MTNFDWLCPVPEGELPVPKLHDGAIEGCVGYAPIALEFLGGAPLALSSAEEAQGCVAWLERTEAARRGYFLGLLDDLGAPVGGLPEQPDALLPLAEWFDNWSYPSFAAWNGAEFELNRNPKGMTTPGHKLHHALRSLALDLGFVVAGAARSARPELKWRPVKRRSEERPPPGEGPTYYYVPTLLPGDSSTDLIVQIWTFVWGSVAPYVRRPRGDFEDWLRSLHRGTLRRLYEGLVSGKPLSGPRSPGWSEPPLPNLQPLRPVPKTVEVPASLVDAVAAYRRAGWFAKRSKVSDAFLAGSLARKWRALSGDDIAAVDGEELDYRLLQVDDERTLAMDIEADVSEGEEVYTGLLHGLSARSGGAFKVARAKEDWRAPGEVLLRFHLSGEPRELLLGDCGDYVDPGVVTGMNRLLPEGGPRFWFVDNGGQLAIVTRATELEREVLQSLRPVRLSLEPPGWWASVRSYPS